MLRSLLVASLTLTLGVAVLEDRADAAPAHPTPRPVQRAAVRTAGVHELARTTPARVVPKPVAAKPVAAKPAAKPAAYPTFVARSTATASGTCAVSVAPYVAARPGGDDTIAFHQAMATAIATAPTCHAAGPSGAPQAVVYVPPGTYRLLKLAFPNNLRLEVDAGATLQLPANRPRVPSTQWTPMILWDAPAGSARPLTNVSLVGVGRRMDARKDRLLATSSPALAPFDLSRDFTMNLDPRATGSSNYNTGLNIADVSYFEVANVFSVQNGTNAPAGTKLVPWPTSARAVIQLYAPQNSPIGGPFRQPRFGTITNHVNIDSPRGYGPNQINAGDHVTLTGIYSRGGTALRLETDASTDGKGNPTRGARLDHLVARDIVGVDCNRAVALMPHGQDNGSVIVDNVWAYSCSQSVAANIDPNMAPANRGRFTSASVSLVHVNGGDGAQLDSPALLWRVGPSLMPYYVAPAVTWSPRIGIVERSGRFTQG